MKIMQTNLLITIILIYLGNVLHLEANPDGFSVELIHKNSPKSPVYDPQKQATPLENYKNGIERGKNRARRLQGNLPKSELTPDTNGEHLMKFSIGTPPMDVYGIVDTGSDLFWLQCQPCEQCFKQNSPIYNPKSSSSYADVKCKTPDCNLLDTVSCSSTNLCNYTYGYGDKSLTRGVLAKETVSFSGVPVKNIVFGCGHNNQGVFTDVEMGLVGLGGRDLSLTSQVGSQLGAKRFSYCLVPSHSDPKTVSKMNFGAGSEVTGAGVVSTPLLKLEDTTPYYVSLKGFKVGKTLVPYSSSKPEGTVFIDSGVPPFLVPKDFFNRLVEAIKKEVKTAPYQDQDLGTQFCYKTNDIAADLPTLTVQFGSGGEIPLVPASTFIMAKDGVYCFGFEAIDAEIGVFGNYAQSNFRIAFDLDKHVVSFKQTDCAKEP